MSITWLFLKAKNSALAAIPGRARAAPCSSPAFSACGRGIWLVPTCSGSFGAGSSRHQPRCLCWRQSRALNHAGDAPRLGFGWVYTAGRVVPVISTVPGSAASRGCGILEDSPLLPKGIWATLGRILPFQPAFPSPTAPWLRVLQPPARSGWGELLRAVVLFFAGH